MEIRVLGPVEVCRDDVAVSLSGRKPRTVLAMLAVNAGRVVSADQLVEAVWGTTLPANERAVLQTYVSVLRRALGDRGPDQEPIVRQGSGYQLVPGSVRVDLQVFQQLAQAGRKALAENRFVEAARQLDAALALWRGNPLSGVDGGWADLERGRLTELRLAAVEDRVEADLALGHGAKVIAELTPLVTEYPLRERPRAQLMRALNQTGRQAEALDCFDQGRRLLVDELGVEPGPELRATHARILRAEEPSQAVEIIETVPVPCQLPPDIADFTGRTVAVKFLCDNVLAPGTATRICAVSGQPGAGKSALAVHVAHRLREHFDGGQLYVCLRGVHAVPQDPAEVLAGFLRALGVADAAIPTSLEERTQLYRTLVADRRVLVVLDDAAGEAQVRPLLPGGSGCAVLITSRVRLAVLAGAAHVDLQVFGELEAIDLLGRLAGADRVAREPDDAAAIVRLCGHLPLAVRITGARLAARPRWPLAQLVTKLGAQQQLLNELTLGDLEVRGSLSLSYEGLDPAGRTALRRLGWLGAPEFAAWLVAPLLGCPAREAEDVLERLVDAQLLDALGTDLVGSARYRLHDLTWVFARERADSEELAATALSTVERVARCALALVEQASDRMPSGVARPFQRGQGDQLLDEATVSRLLTDPVTWFDAEQTVLITLVERASELDLVTAASALAAALCSSSFSVRNQFGQWWRTHAAALTAAHRTGDRVSEALLLTGLGRLRYEQDRLDEAADYFHQAIVIYDDVQDLERQATTRLSLSAVQREWGKLAEGLRTLDEVADALEAIGDPRALARAALGRGMLLVELGDTAAAMVSYQRALSSYQGRQDSFGEALALRSIGIAYRADGRLDEAETPSEQAVDMLRELGDELMLAYAQQSLAKVRIRQGRGEDSRLVLERCLQTCGRLQDGFGQALMLRTLGELELAEGRPVQARQRLEHSLQWWTALDLPLWRARTLRDVATALQALGEDAAADTAWTEALAGFRQHGSREAREPRPAATLTKRFTTR